MTRRRAVITGRGAVTPLGADWPATAAALARGEAARTQPYPGSEAPDPPLCFAIAPDALEASPVREGEPLARLTGLAVAEALREAGLPIDGETTLDDAGLVASTVLGPATAVESYIQRLRERGPRACRPAHFVDTLLSMHASRAGIALRLRGSTAVVGGTPPFEIALDWVRSGREPLVVAGGADYLSPKTCRYYHALASRAGNGRPLPAQAAAFLAIEDAARASERRAAPLGELLGSGGASAPQEASVPWPGGGGREAFVSSARAALADAGLDASGVRAAVLAAGDDAFEEVELAALREARLPAGAALLRPKRLLGEALAASGPLALLWALEAADGPVLVNAFELGGNVSTLIVGPAP